MESGIVVVAEYIWQVFGGFPVAAELHGPDVLSLQRAVKRLYVPLLFRSAVCHPLPCETVQDVEEVTPSVGA